MQKSQAVCLPASIRVASFNFWTPGASFKIVVFLPGEGQSFKGGNLKLLWMTGLPPPYPPEKPLVHLKHPVCTRRK